MGKKNCNENKGEKKSLNNVLKPCIDFLPSIIGKCLMVTSHCYVLGVFITGGNNKKRRERTDSSKCSVYNYTIDYVSVPYLPSLTFHAVVCSFQVSLEVLGTLIHLIQHPIWDSQLAFPLSRA